MSVSSNKKGGVTTSEVNTEVDNALNTAIPGGPTSDSINERIATMDGRITGTVSTVTTAQVNTEVDNALDTAIPGSPTGDSINERIKSIDTYITAAPPTAAEINAEVDTALNTAVTSGTTNSLNERIIAIDGFITEAPPTEAEINAQVDSALDTAIPGSPTGDSINERIKSIDTFITAAPPTASEIEGKVDDALDNAVPGSPTSHSINERIKTMDDAFGSLGIADISTVTTAQVNTQVDSALDTAIPGSPTSNSINERIKTLDDNLTLANLETQCDNSLDNAISSPTANSAAGILEQLNKGTKVDFKEAYANIQIGSSGSSGYNSIVDVDDKVGWLTSIDVYVSNATAGQQAGAYATLSVALSGGTADTIEMCYNGSFQINWLIHRDGIASAASGVADHVRYHFNQPFISTTNSLNVGVTVTPGSAGGELFMRVMYAVEI